VTYTGNGSTQTISGLEFSPDLVWIKNRSSIASHHIYDIIRGTGIRLQSDTTNAEATRVGVSAFNSDGFDLGSDAGSNVNNNAFVAWAWDGGTSTVSNSDGIITSQVRANPSAGFSIATYTGNNLANATVGHGLGVTPEFVVVKRRNATGNWIVYHKGMTGPQYYMYLNSTAAESNQGGLVNTWGVSLTAITFKEFFSDYNASGGAYVMYCFAPVDGFSSFGSYVGNGLSDGPFVYTGHRSRFIMIKRTDGNAPWVIVDTARNTYNAMDNHLLADDAVNENASTIGNICDSLSNGFKLRGSDGWFNNIGANYLYISFAEHPFKTARAK
jgi:hypothetical protein